MSAERKIEFARDGIVFATVSDTDSEGERDGLLITFTEVEGDDEIKSEEEASVELDAEEAIELRDFLNSLALD